MGAGMAQARGRVGGGEARGGRRGLSGWIGQLRLGSLFVCHFACLICYALCFLFLWRTCLLRAKSFVRLAQ